MRALKAALAVLLALGVLTAGTMLPQKLLRRRAAEYGAMTAQAAVADIHPYGDAYMVKQTDYYIRVEMRAEE